MQSVRFCEYSGKTAKLFVFNNFSNLCGNICFHIKHVFKTFFTKSKKFRNLLLMDRYVLNLTIIKNEFA